MSMGDPHCTTCNDYATIHYTTTHYATIHSNTPHNTHHTSLHHPHDDNHENDDDGDDDDLDDESNGEECRSSAASRCKGRLAAALQLLMRAELIPLRLRPPPRSLAVREPFTVREMSNVKCFT